MHGTDNLRINVTISYDPHTNPYKLLTMKSCTYQIILNLLKILFALGNVSTEIGLLLVEGGDLLSNTVNLFLRLIHLRLLLRLLLPASAIEALMLAGIASVAKTRKIYSGQVLARLA